MSAYEGLSPEARRTLARLVEDLGDSADEIAAAVADRITGEVPEYGRYAEANGGAGFVSAVRGIVDGFLEAAASGRQLTSPERDEAARVGERRARDGHSRGAVVAALNAGFDLGRSRIFAAFWRLSSPRQERRALEALVGFLDGYKFEVIEAFRDGFDRVDVEERREHDRARDAFLTDLLLAPPDLRRVGARAVELGVELTPPLELVVVTVPAGFGAPEPGVEREDTVQGRVSRLARRLPTPTLGPVSIDHPAGTPPLRCILVVDATPFRRREAIDAVTAGCDELGLIAVHASVPAAGALHATLQRLMAVMPVLDRVTCLLGAVVTPEAVYGHRLVGAASVAEQEFELRTVVGRLHEFPQTAGQHVETIEALLEEQFNMAAAARRLGISADAVKKRVERIEKITGLTFRDRRDVRRFDLALCLLDLHQGTLPEPGDPWWTRAPGASTSTHGLGGESLSPPIGGDSDS